MARRVKRKRHDSSERWLVSYADLLTLLFAFFVVMFASTQADKSRAQQISQAVQKALQSGVTPRLAAILGGSIDDKGHGNAQLKGAAFRPRENAVDEPLRQLDLNTAITTLRTTLNTEMNHGQVSIHLEPRGAVISLNAQAVFPSGGETVDKAIYPLVEKVAAILNQLPNAVRLEGNTDALPINNARFRSNWELSAARSIAMLRLLNERYGVSRERMAIIGYADTNAVADNKTEEGRTKNRRVDLVILSEYGLRDEPQTKSTPPSAH